MPVGSKLLLASGLSEYAIGRNGCFGNWIHGNGIDCGPLWYREGNLWLVAKDTSIMARKLV